ncbi:constitutive coactivator of peroxisome proliferator-activated receptor gamma isoform X2 [Amia ocellicauda]|uniref:constitutive coactivator of peroxisome proliferator-activated receptor gamma isoform X2 n=1 Tax=Amia ocellicauda TaxID=2972642 RepID=UPI003463D0A5
MGVKGLQGFVDNVCPGVCVKVNLREMANRCRQDQPGCTPTLVVDGMACLRHWYTCEAWVHGGQWQEYLHCLETFIRAFKEARIQLVFFFDGTVEEEKRAEWVKRRLRNNKEIQGIFKHIKANGQQPGRAMFYLPSGLATFSLFALKTLGVETWCSVREADYEIARYALLHKCMGILGQDTDFLIFDTVPYLSISQLKLDRMVTLLFSRENLCHSLQLYTSDLPLLACMLGNDIVPENRLASLRNACVAEYQQRHSASPAQRHKVYAVADYIARNRSSTDGLKGIARLPLSEPDRAVLEKGVRMYLLPDQQSPWVESTSKPPSPVSMGGLERYCSNNILKAAEERHRRAECFMVFNVLCAGIVECSNTFEDEEDSELPGQAIIYRAARERLYGLLLPTKTDGIDAAPKVKEYFVYYGNSLQQPDLVTPVPPNLPGGTPALDILWFSQNPEVKTLRFSTFLAVFDLQDVAEDLGRLNPPLIALSCLLIYIALQESSLCLEDVDAYISTALCVPLKTYGELACIEVPWVDARAVQLGSLFVRGLATLIAANSACGLPLDMDSLMPWKMFDGLLFHSKYLQSHSGYTEEQLLEENVALLPHFHQLKSLVTSTCRRRDKTIPSWPRGGPSAKPVGGGSSSRERRPLFCDDRGQPPHLGPRHPLGDPSASQQEQGHRPRYRNQHRQRYRLAPRSSAWWSLRTAPPLLAVWRN